ncbi:hypothetical protein JTB14_009835 [Gonioctena quinquepunctata]|nr:hypothetical protein JTB14_009835 [Gonioctena quinquepunctata]
MKISFKVKKYKEKRFEKINSNTAQEDNITEKAKGNKEGMGNIDDGVITVTRAGWSTHGPSLRQDEKDNRKCHVFHVCEEGNQDDDLQNLMKGQFTTE